MLDIQKIHDCWHFSPLRLEAGKMLFDQWESDDYLYIIVSWSLEIRKYRDNTRSDSKLLARLDAWEVFWEAALENSLPKEVSIWTGTDVELLKIHTGEAFELFIKQEPELCLHLFRAIIASSNKRVSGWNTIITATDEMSRQIRELTTINYKSIFALIDNMCQIVPCNRILYVEKHSTLPGYYILRYNTRHSGKLLSEVIESGDLSLRDIENVVWQSSEMNILESLRVGSQTIWYLVYGKMGSAFDNNEMKIISSISPLVWGIIHHKKIMDDNG